MVQVKAYIRSGYGWQPYQIKMGAKVKELNFKKGHTNNTRGYLWGLEEVVERGLPDFVESFKTKKERDNFIKKNNLKVVK